MRWPSLHEVTLFLTWLSPWDGTVSMSMLSLHEVTLSPWVCSLFMRLLSSWHGSLSLPEVTLFLMWLSLHELALSSRSVSLHEVALSPWDGSLSNRWLSLHEVALWTKVTSVTKAIILTHSQSVLHKVHNGHLWHEWVPILNSFHVQGPVCIYCLGHAGVWCNKRADLMASCRNIHDGLKRHCKAKYEHLLVEDARTYKASLYKILECGIKCGSSENTE